MPPRTRIAGQETGKAKVDDDKIAITGGWKSEKSSYEASYSGTFVRRSAKLTASKAGRTRVNLYAHLLRRD